MRTELLHSFPSSNIHYAACRVSEVEEEIGAADIVIDSTGEISVREELNQWHLARSNSQGKLPILQHTWIEGNGAACFSFFNRAPQGACGRCVRGRNHTDEPRYKTSKRREEYDGILCGGTVYAPYGPQAAIMAAGLAMQHLVETINEVSKGTFRALQIDIENSNYTRPSTPGALKGYPACQPRS